MSEPDLSKPDGYKAKVGAARHAREANLAVIASGPDAPKADAHPTGLGSVQEHMQDQDLSARRCG